MSKSKGKQSSTEVMQLWFPLVSVYQTNQIKGKIIVGLVKCKVCKNNVSSSAENCPLCGYRLKLRWYEGRWSVVFRAVFIISLLLLGMAICSSFATH